MGPNPEKMSEAQVWIQRLPTLQEHISENNHILYPGKKENDMLSRFRKPHRSLSQRLSVRERQVEMVEWHAGYAPVFVDLHPGSCTAIGLLIWTNDAVSTAVLEGIKW
ncbi:hypothetical protein HPG69_010454 [Diceros bicornis minor]|uniref:Uncharacterized protein n=1 Tax=Diceros bicornis minor TaxID=77932 RepID=A0A7J7F7H6_DICBM|nr:hypothetical protein HPG69_010454 [Diceros bicornis minor]